MNDIERATGSILLLGGVPVQTKVEQHKRLGCPCRKPKTYDKTCNGHCSCNSDAHPGRGGILLPSLECDWRPFWLMQAEGALFSALTHVYAEPTDVKREIEKVA